MHIPFIRIEPLRSALDADAHLAARERPEHLLLERVKLAVPHQARTKADVEQRRRVAATGLAVVGKADPPRVSEAIARLMAARTSGAARRRHPRVEEKPLAERDKLLAGPPADLQAARARRELRAITRGHAWIAGSAPVSEQPNRYDENGANRARRQRAT